jgi:predicted PurR-regulated permease PerM
MTIVMVVAAALLLLAIREVSRVLVWIVVAIFFAVALNPVVSWFDRKVTGHRRALSTLLVFLSLVVILGGLIAAFAVPLAREGTAFAGQLPSILDDAKAGRGTIGHFLDQTNALKLIQDHQDQIKHYASGLTTPAVGVLSGVATTVAGLVTILVLAYLMVLEAPKIIDSGLNLIDRTQTRERVRAVGADCARSVTGYLSGNLLISVICGVIHYVALRAMGVPFAGLIALFVAIADLVPLVGATIGGIVALLAAALHSLPALIVVAVVFVVYQQLENHLLQPLVFARTVNLNPLTVLVAILLAVELAGILGALLAIPVASIIQVISRDLWDHRRGRPKEQPTVGEERRDADAPESEDQVQQPASAGQVGS